MCYLFHAYYIHLIILLQAMIFVDITHAVFPSSVSYSKPVDVL